ncbi:MAG: hypothetical protein ACOY5B_18735 [Spirochaetota bacterium]
MNKFKTINLTCLLAMGLSPWLTSACKDSNQLPKDGPIRPMKEYSIGNSREWVEMEKRLAPQVRKSVNEGKPALLVEVPNAKVDQGTYIEKIGVMNMDGSEIAVTTIKRERNPLTYAYFDWNLIPWSGKIKAFVKWNKYDLWVQEIKVSDIPGNK